MGLDEAKVDGGAFRADITADEGRLDDGLLEKAVRGEGFGPVKAISDTVTVCAQVRPNNDLESPQPPDVMKAIGENGANFESSPQKQATELGQLRAGRCDLDPDAERDHSGFGASQTQGRRHVLCLADAYHEGVGNSGTAASVELTAARRMEPAVHERLHSGAV